MSERITSDSALGGSPTETPQEIEARIAAIEVLIVHLGAIGPESTGWLIKQLRAARDQNAEQEADAARYRFLKPFLCIDGDVNDADYPSRHFNFLYVNDENIPLCDGWGVHDVDAAIDDALRAVASSSQETPE